MALYNLDSFRFKILIQESPRAQQVDQSTTKQQCFQTINNLNVQIIKEETAEDTMIPVKTPLATMFPNDK